MTGLEKKVFQWFKLNTTLGNGICKNRAAAMIKLFDEEYRKVGVNKKFKVTGTGHFPFDMLRYDQCWPTTEGNMQALHEFNRTPVTIELETNSKYITPARWSSFMWKVVQ